MARRGYGAHRMDGRPLGRRLRWGMVGGGEGAFIGAVHRRAARLDDGFELLAGCLSADAARARRSAQACRIPSERAYADYDAMAQAEADRPDGIEVVTIATPNATHHAIARAFLERGIHVICDKPLATTVAQARELVGLADR